MITQTFQETKLAIVGNDATAFHVFNMLYKNDDRYKVLFFINSDLSTHIPNLKKYEKITIIPKPNCISDIQGKSIEKVVLAPCNLVQGNFMNMTALYMSANFNVISHPFEQLQLSPPKPLISFFADTQFASPIFCQILKLYLDIKAKPIVVFPMPRKMICDNQNPYIKVTDKTNLTDLEKCEYELCRDICELNVPIFFVVDFPQFNKDIARDDTFNLIFFVGFRSMPCFYSSHFLIYACDDFTFGEGDIDDHPSSVICREMANVIFYCHMKKDDISLNKLKEYSSVPIVQLDVKFHANKSHCFQNLPVIPFDDPYPCLCNCQESMATWIATQFNMKPIDMRPYKDKNPYTFFYEPIQLDLPSMMHPSSYELSYFPDVANKVKENVKDLYVLTTAMEPSKIENVKEVVEVKFDIDLSLITIDLIKLPNHIMRLISKQSK